MKKATTKMATKKDLANAMRQDKKDDMKMIKKAITKKGKK